MAERERRVVRRKEEGALNLIKSRKAFLPLYILGILGLGLMPTFVYLFETDLARRRDEASNIQAQWNLEMMGKLDGSLPLSGIERFVAGARVRHTETGYLNVRNYVGIAFPNGIKVEVVETLSPGALIKRVLLTEGGSRYFNPSNPNSPKGTWAVFPCEDIEKSNPKLLENKVCAVFAGYLEADPSKK